MRKKRRVLLLVSSLSGGGAERVAVTLSNAWVANGDEVILVPTYLGSSESVYDVSGRVRVLPLRDFIPAFLAVPFLNGLGKLVALRRLAASVEPHVVVTFLTNVNVVALVALHRRDYPLAVCERVDPAASVELPWTLRFARRWLYRYADALVTQTSAAAAAYRALIHKPPNIAIIPNPLPNSLETIAARALPAAVETRRIVAMGRLTQQKQFDLLIRAYGDAFGTESEWTLHVYGEGPCRAPLEKLIHTLDLTGRVRLEGHTVDPWLVLAGAQLFVLSSAYEGFPNAMLEAMSLGVPCIAFDCPSGPREIASDGVAAALIPCGDVPALAAEMRKLALDRDAREKMGRAGALSVRSRFAEHTVVDQWERLFESLHSP